MNSKQDGFTYVEVIIAVVILMFGVLAVLSGVSAAVFQSRAQQQQLEARHVAATTLESIFSVKETDPARLGWAAVGNVGSNLDSNGVPQGVFVNGFQQVMSDAGPDEIVGTADDTGTPVRGMQREIVITDQCDPDRPSQNCATPGPWAVRIRTVRVTVRYMVGGAVRDEQATTILTDYAVTE